MAQADLCGASDEELRNFVVVHGISIGRIGDIDVVHCLQIPGRKWLDGLFCTDRKVLWIKMKRALDFKEDGSPHDRNVLRAWLEKTFVVNSVPPFSRPELTLW